MTGNSKPKPRPRGRGKWRLCPSCGGMGFRMVPRRAAGTDETLSDTIVGPEKCKTCNGKGWTGT